MPLALYALAAGSSGPGLPMLRLATAAYPALALPMALIAIRLERQ